MKRRKTKGGAQSRVSFVRSESGVEKISTLGTNTLEKEGCCTESRLSEMIDKYDKLIFSICYKLTGDYFMAEDLMQETFLTAYQKYHTFDGSNEKAWLSRIATNKSIDYLRSAGKRSVPTEDAFFELYQEQRSSPEEICMEEEVKRELARRCEGLKPPYDQVARAYYVEERTAREIAKGMGRSLKTVQTQIYRAREMLKKIYGKEEPA